MYYTIFYINTLSNFFQSARVNTTYIQMYMLALAITCIIFRKRIFNLSFQCHAKHALRVNFETFGHTTKNKIFRLVKLLADLSTRL